MVNYRFFPIGAFHALRQAAIRLFHSAIRTDTPTGAALDTPLRFHLMNRMPFSANRLSRADPDARLTTLTGRGNPVSHTLPHDQ